ncbi:MAG: hypothetical protein WB799_14845 [Candidatus Sulfotelmatobacter sp.]
MFLLYKVTKTPPSCRFDLLRETHLFGCNKGFVPRYLRSVLPADANEPYKWHFKTADALHALEPDADAFVIDLKPNNKKNASRYEVREFAGYSDNDWTPAMLKMGALLVDQDADKYPRESFVLSQCDGLDEVITFLHFSGSVKDGSLVLKWVAPGRSSTNSVLLWPEVFNYFCSQLRQP